MTGKILFVKKNPKGIYGFIELPDGSTQYYDTASLQTGTFLKAGLYVDFDITTLWDGRTKAINVRLSVSGDNSSFIKIEESTKEMVLSALMCKLADASFLDCAKVAPMLKNLGVDYKLYANSLGSFIEKYFSGQLSIKKSIVIGDKEYPAVLVKDAEDSSEGNSKEPLNESTICGIREAILRELNSKGFLLGSSIPFLLRELGVPDFRSYAPTVEEFIAMCFPGEFEMRKDVQIGDKRYPNVILRAGGNVFATKYQSYFDAGDYESILSAVELQAISPLELGDSGIEFLLKSLFGYLGENLENASLNDFHRILINTDTVVNLKQYRDDQRLLALGAETAFVPIAYSDFTKIFANIHNGKKNLNNNWNGIIERFWTAKSDLASYLTCIWLIICKNEKCIDLYIDEAAKESKIDRIIHLLKIYTGFITGGNNRVTPRLQKKIIGHCFDCNDIKTLIAASSYFGERGIPEVYELIGFLNGQKLVDSEVLMKWFRSEMGQLIGEKIINFYWWTLPAHEITPELFKTLASVFWEYPENYYTEIIYNMSIPSFGRKEKEAIIRARFSNLCHATRSYKKAYALVNYVYNTLIAETGEEAAVVAWESLKSWMKSTVVHQFAADIRTAANISIFRMDAETKNELEKYYCEHFIDDLLQGIDSEEELDELTGSCEEWELHFIIQRINQRGLSSRQDDDRNIQALINSRKFGDAIKYIQAESFLNNSQKISQLRNVLCQNFSTNYVTDEAFSIFRDCIPVDIAEAILLADLHFADSFTIAALISLYIYKGEWIKAAYLYAPFKKIHLNAHRKFIEDVRLVMLNNGLDANKYTESHFNAVKTALGACTVKQFDAFISWAKEIIIPQKGNAYTPIPKTFDSEIKSMLDGRDYELCWKQLLMAALKTDNNDNQDSLRFCIITGYVSRYGIDSFNDVIALLAKNRLATKNYAELYSSLWKGLLSGKYSVNFLHLTCNLIDSAPITFWNLFFDVAAVKNHVFSYTDFGLQTWSSLVQDYQAFYSKTLEQYVATRETVFLKIATHILAECPVVLEAEFDKYLPYCNSGRNKDFIFCTIINLIYKQKYLREIEEFIRSDYWRCTESEQELLNLLSAFCKTNPSDIVGKYEFLATLGLDQFRRDVLKCLLDYPDFNVNFVAAITDGDSLYGYMLMLSLLRIKHVPEFKHEVERVPTITDDWRNDALLKAYLELAAEIYRKQLGAVQKGKDDIIYVKNRYLRIYAAELMLEHSFEQFDDDQIVGFMRSNNHFAAVYSDYLCFKRNIAALISRKDADATLNAIFLTCFISNNWQQFISNGERYGSDALMLIHDIMMNSNYRDLNIQIIKRYVFDSDSADEVPEIAYLEALHPDAFSAISKMRQISSGNPEIYARCKKHVFGICRMKSPSQASLSYKYMRHALEKYNSDIQMYFDMYISALKATSYTKTILIIMADEIIRRKIEVDAIRLWMPVFDALGELQSYYYLLAVRNALNRDRDRTLEAFSHIGSMDAIPKEWREDAKNLEAYAIGTNKTFYISSSSAIQTVAMEQSAEAVSFVSRFSSGADADIQTAVKAYRVITQKSAEKAVKLGAYRQLFSFIKKPEALFDVYRQADGTDAGRRDGRLTYNELVIAFGCTLINLSSELDHDEKLDILLEIFQVFELLNDFNKNKDSITSMMREAEQTVLETPGVSFDHWMVSRESIMAIMKHQTIDCPEAVVDEWRKPVSECADIISECGSEMQKLAELSAWRSTWNLKQGCSDYENAFVRSVDKAIQQLRNGINLSLEVVGDAVEDGCVFYQIVNNASSNPTSVLLNNDSSAGCARLEVFAGINSDALEPYEGSVFSNTVELRPGDVCGQSYRLHDRILTKVKPGDTVRVVLNVIAGNKVICCNSKEQRAFRVTESEALLGADIVPKSVKYGTAFPAFSRTIRGFGRDAEKKLIREYLDQQLVVIYGPSRAGKSSLMNYISNAYLQTFAAMPERADTSVISINIADDRHGDDYDASMLSLGDDVEKVQYDSVSQLMRYLFIAPLKIAFLPEYESKKGRRCSAAGKPFPDSVKAGIVKILNRSSGVRDMLSDIAQVLEDNNCQIWMLFDEFQKVVEKWPGETQELVDLCSDIKSYQNGFKIVICGSDDLVRLFQCESDADWNKFVQVTVDNNVYIGQLNFDDFSAMMNDRDIWRGLPDDVPWSRSALELLYKYTGGNAICGKLFGNELLSKLQKGTFSARKSIYPSDITQIAYELLNSNVGLVKNLLVIHNTKNLDNEIPYLIFIAHQLIQNRNKSSVSIRRIREFFAAKANADIDLSMKILVARGILKEEKQRYGFTTMFYFDFFRSQATDTRIQELADSLQQGRTLEPVVDNPYTTQKITSYFRDLGDVDQSGLLGSLILNASNETKEQVKKVMGSSFGGDNVENKYVQVNIQNIQNITNAFSVILGGTDDLELLDTAYRSLPTLQQYRTMCLSEADQSRLRQLPALIQSAKNETEAEQYVREMEMIEAPAQEEMCSNYAHAIINAGGELLEELSDVRLQKLLCLDRVSQVESLRLLPGEFQLQFNFATILHSIFEKFKGSEAVDYCPVALMYCKLIEAILKQLHTQLYIDCLPNATIGPNLVTYGDLADPGVYSKYKKKLTIGSFTYPIIFVNKHDPSKSNIKLDIIRELCPERREQRKWEQHALALAIVQVCRNKSAHDSVAITRDELDTLIHTLFTDEGLIRMVELVQA